MKSQTVLEMYYRLQKGEIVEAKKITEEFGVGDRTVYRYLRDLRLFFSQHKEGSLVLDKATGGYVLRR